MSDVEHHSQRTIKKLRLPRMKVFQLTGLAILWLAVIVFVIQPDSRGELLSSLVPYALLWLKVK